MLLQILSISYCSHNYNLDAEKKVLVLLYNEIEKYNVTFNLTTRWYDLITMLSAFSDLITAEIYY